MRLVRVVAAVALTAGLVGAAPAAAAAPAPPRDDTVTLRVPGSIRVGGSPGAVTVVVVKRTKGCVLVRTALAISLPGLSASQVDVQVASDGQWQPVAVSGGGGLVTTARTAPDRAELCRSESVAARYRIAFRAGTPAGVANLVGEAYSAGGLVLGRATGAVRVVGAATPSPRVTPSASPSASPTPSATPTTSAPTTPAETATTAAAAVPQNGTGGGGSAGLGPAVMVAGLAMVAGGIALLVLIVRRSRTDDAPTLTLPPIP